MFDAYSSAVVYILLPILRRTSRHLYFGVLVSSELCVMISTGWRTTRSSPVAFCRVQTLARARGGAFWQAAAADGILRRLDRRSVIVIDRERHRGPLPGAHHASEKLCLKRLSAILA